MVSLARVGEVIRPDILGRNLMSIRNEIRVKDSRGKTNQFSNLGVLLCFLIDKMGVSSERRSGAPSFQLFMFAVDNLTAPNRWYDGSAWLSAKWGFPKIRDPNIVP